MSEFLRAILFHGKGQNTRMRAGAAWSCRAGAKIGNYGILEAGMDKVIRITAGIFIFIFVVFAATGLYGLYVGNEYRRTLVSTYSYTLTISTSEKLQDVTFFIPVPANTGGNSPFVEQYSTATFTGIPAGWEASLLGSNKATMLKIRAPVIAGSDGAGFSVRTSSDARTGQVIDTRSPQDRDIVLRPVQELKEVSCAEFRDAAPGATCYRYQCAVYADYESSPNAKVEISSTITGKNEWKIFEPAYNRYTNAISVTMLGNNHGWVTAKGELQAGIGSYDAPKI
jgi:hypothetical protein